VSEVYIKNTTERGWNAFQKSHKRDEDSWFIMPFCGLGNPWSFGMWSPDPPIYYNDYIKENYITITEEEFDEKYKQSILDSKKEVSENIIAEREK